MRSIADEMLAQGAIRNREAVHGETIRILSGPDAGRDFIGVIENQPDQILGTDLSDDPRGKRTLEFVTAPNTENKPIRVQSADGRQWTATRQDFGADLVTKFDLVEVTSLDS